MSMLNIVVEEIHFYFCTLLKEWNNYYFSNIKCIFAKSYHLREENVKVDASEMQKAISLFKVHIKYLNNDMYIISVSFTVN